MPEQTVAATHPFLCYAHTVEIHIDFGSIITGKALKLIKRSPYGKLVVPQAQVLDINFLNRPVGSTGVAEFAQPCMRAFAAQLKLVVPKVKTVNASYCWVGQKSKNSVP
ncbi:hypothetical protein GGI21_005001, partial [Coemansia aciculifera]